MALPLSPQAIDSLTDMAANGSPALVTAAGRLVGFGQEEREALIAGRIPPWLWIGMALVGGVLIGARVQNTWPKALPRWATGRRKG